MTDASGNFQFRMLRPTGAGAVTLSAFEVSGLAAGRAVQDYQLPLGPQERHLDFKTAAAAAAARLTGTSYDGTTYLAVGPTVYQAGVGGAPGTGFGWQTGSILTFDRGAANPNPVLSDGHYTTSATFLVDLPAGMYEVTPTLGDSVSRHDLVNITVGGTGITSGTGLVAQGITTTPPGSLARPTSEDSPSATSW